MNEILKAIETWLVGCAKSVTNAVFDTIEERGARKIEQSTTTTQEVETKVEAQPIEAESPKEEKRQSAIEELKVVLRERGASNADDLAYALNAYRRKIVPSVEITYENLDVWVRIYEAKPDLWEKCVNTAKNYFREKPNGSRSTSGAGLVILCEHDYSFDKAVRAFRSDMAKNNGAVRFSERVNDALNGKAKPHRGRPRKRAERSRNDR